MRAPLETDSTLTLPTSPGAMLGTVVDGRLVLDEVHRFPTRSLEGDDGPRWDVDGLFDAITKARAVQTKSKAEKAAAVPENLNP